MAPRIAASSEPLRHQVHGRLILRSVLFAAFFLLVPSAEAQVCGDGMCTKLHENHESCPADCAPTPVCGNAACEAGESQSTCPADCVVCGDGMCTKLHENHESCPADCSPPSVCGNGACEAGEDRSSCPGDCVVCGDGVCSKFRENSDSCPTDCPVICNPTDCKFKCGIQDDGCGNDLDCGPCACVPNVPTFTYQPAHPVVGQPITLTADSTLILDPPTPLWDLGNTVHLPSDPLTQSLTYSYPTAGTYNVVLTASESACQQTMLSAPAAVIVSPVPGAGCVPTKEEPDLCCGNNVCNAWEPVLCPSDCPGATPITVLIEAPDSVEPNATVAFRVVVTPTIEISTIEWTFGDGATGSGADVYHSFESIGLYTVTVKIGSAHGELGQTKVVSVQFGEDVHGSGDIICRGGGCDHSEEFRYDPVHNRLVAAARFWIDRTTGDDWRKHHVAIQAKVKDPSNAIVFDSGIVDAYERFLQGLQNSVHEIEVDFHGFAEAAFNPKNGTWLLMITYYYRPVETRGTRPISQGNEDVPATISSCLLGPCDLQPKNADVREGTVQEFVITNPAPTHSYSWDWRFTRAVPSASPYVPAAHLTVDPGTRKATSDKPQWIPVPASSDPIFNCRRDKINDQALTGSQYELAVSESGSPAVVASTKFTVIVPWGFRENTQDSIRDENDQFRWSAAATSNPDATYLNIEDSQILCDSTHCRLDPERMVFHRIGSIPRYPPTLHDPAVNGLFKAKLVAHEEAHVEFWEEHPCGLKFFQTEGLKAALHHCVVAGDCAQGIGGRPIALVWRSIKKAANMAEKAFHTEETIAARAVLKFNEQFAYGKSDSIEPRFIYMNCDRFVNRSCTR